MSSLRIQFRFLVITRKPCHSRYLQCEGPTPELSFSGNQTCYFAACDSLDEALHFDVPIEEDMFEEPEWAMMVNMLIWVALLRLSIFE